MLQVLTKDEFWHESDRGDMIERGEDCLVKASFVAYETCFLQLG